MDIREERKLIEDDPILYAEIAHCYQNCEIPVECPCGISWEKEFYLSGCSNCGFRLRKEHFENS